MGVDVRELIRTSQTTVANGPTQEDVNVKQVIFTFVGPEGLIEGGDNQQFEMPVDFNQIDQVQDIKEILKRELVMDSGIDLILREKQSGILLEQIEDIHIAVDSGEGILVQFVENEIENSGNNQMANINEEDEKSEYSDEAFEEEDDDKDGDKKKVAPLVPRITKKKVENALHAVKILLMIKKVPKTHVVKYLLRGEAL